MILEKYSIGIGDRFGHQGKGQLNALIKAKQDGVDIVPVWNKSYREHSIIGTIPADVRTEADAAVKNCNWKSSYHVDADHININNVESFIDCSDFFTLDVADYISQNPDENDLTRFVEKYKKFTGSLQIPGIDQELKVDENDIKKIGRKFLLAVQEAGRLYRHLKKAKDTADFITEVSMDETDEPQTPLELFFILAMTSEEGIPAQTIAPKFTGRFNKGVDYVGDVAQFEKEFNEDIAVINFAIEQFDLPENLKLSIHSGSDKFSIYPSIKKALEKFGAGLHLKTAGTTWLEELIGLAEAGGDGLVIAKEIYSEALKHFDELCQPYATVIDIDKNKLPDPQQVNKWDGQTFASTLRHDQNCDNYNLHFRQLLHLSYKIAAQMGKRFTSALKQYEPIIAKNVTQNLYQKHIIPIFGHQADAAG